MKHKFNYEWTLENANFKKNKGSVFSCFACGGGSTMGYKLAGFDVLGCNEIDPKMIEAYRTNHNPKYSFLESIQDFKLREDLPEELYNLDILDGSPPCSSFSMSGNREKDWGKDKKFREGQVKQTLDTLFFDFIDLAKKLKPKVVIAENVKGLLMGNAKEYVKEIYKEFDKAGYYCQHWVLDASKMGVPQRRERIFFICLRKDLSKKFLYQKDMFTEVPKLELNFNEKEIPFKIIQEEKVQRIKLSDSHLKHWLKANNSGRSFETKNKTKFGFFYKAIKQLPLATITSGSYYSIENKPELLTSNEFCKSGTFPLDYNFLNNKPQYLIGMSVPPVMTAQIASQIFNQWLNLI